MLHHTFLIQPESHTDERLRHRLLVYYDLLLLGFRPLADGVLSEVGFRWLHLLADVIRRWRCVKQ